MHAGFIYSDTRVCKVLLHQARNPLCNKSTRQAYRLGAAPTGLKNLSATILNAILNISNSEWCITALLGCYKDDVCNSRISKISILHANPWCLPIAEKIFLYFCNIHVLPFWRPFCLNSYFIFIFCHNLSVFNLLPMS